MTVDTSKRLKISVIIPSYMRANLLKSALQSLTKQSIPKECFEVIVIDDGSTDDTAEVCRNFTAKLNVRYFKQRNSGIAAAKNLGIFVSDAPILLFFDDDDLADKHLLKEHIAAHAKNSAENIAVLGYTKWHPRLQITEVMNFVTNVGQFLFSYPDLKANQVLDYTYFWGGRSSCKRSLLVKHGIFNQAFRFGSEDIELGYRLSKFGLKVIYNPQAISYMARSIDYDDFCHRCEKQGASQYRFSQLHADPAVQRYCQADNARGKWLFVQKLLTEKVNRVHTLESRLVKIKDKHKTKALLAELRNLYWWTFNAYKIKGFTKAMEADKASATTANSPKQAVAKMAQSDLDYFMKKWGNAAPLPPEQKNILIIDPVLPMFDRASGCLRLFRIIEALLSFGFRITFIARDIIGAEKYVPILQNLGVEVYCGDPLALEAAGLNQIKPYLDVENILKRRHFKYAILSFWEIAEYYLPIIREHSPGSEIIIDTVDIHFIREIREAELRQDKRALENAYQRKAREIAIYRKADRLWAITPADKKALDAQVEAVPIEIIPNIHRGIEERKSFDATADLLFVGNFNHPPNRDAVQYFCSKIFPLFQTDLPAVKLYIVGNNPGADVKRLASDHIIVTGYVEDLSPYLGNARISVNPLRYGAGMKGKIGEALSWGLPVVTTSIGAEGMQLVDGEHALISDDHAKFARNIVQLYSNKKLWQKLSDNGRNLVASRWSPEVIRQKLAQLFGQQSAPAAESAQVSIIILTYNALDYTRKCMDSLLDHTRHPFEIIFVDNGSTDGTKQYLRTLVQNHPDFKLIENETNRGFAAGNNQGAAVAAGDYLLFLNNDVLLSDGWLSSMVNALEKDAKIGLVGPMTNSISGRQMYADIPYKNDRDFFRYAAEIRKCQKAVITPRRRIAGFAMLIRKSIFQEVGGFDEAYGTGNFEDDDLCLKVYQKGYAIMVDESTFIHHYGSQTFKANNIDYQKSIEERLKIFRRKWQDVDYHKLLEIETTLESEHNRELSLAEDRLDAGDLTDAEALFREVNRENPLSAAALFGLAQMAFQKENYNHSVKILKKILLLAPDNYKAYNLLGAISYLCSDYRHAEQFFKKALSIKNDDLEIHQNLAETLFAAQKFDEAVRKFEENIVRFPDCPEPLLRMVQISSGSGDLDKSWQYLEAARTIAPNHALVQQFSEQLGQIQTPLSTG